MATKAKVLKGRAAVDAYREAHRLLHSEPWHKGVPEAHTPLLLELRKKLGKLGFNTIQDAFDASDELNIQELGFKDKADFGAKAAEANRKALELKWQ